MKNEQQIVIKFLVKSGKFVNSLLNNNHLSYDNTIFLNTEKTTLFFVK